MPKYKTSPSKRLRTCKKCGEAFKTMLKFSRVCLRCKVTNPQNTIYGMDHLIKEQASDKKDRP